MSCYNYNGKKYTEEELLKELKANEKALGLNIGAWVFNPNNIEVKGQPQILEAVLSKLSESGLANNVYQMTSAELEAKLLELGVEADVAKQVIGKVGAANDENLKASQQKAEKMLDEGVDPDIVEKETGWFKENGDWKFFSKELLDNIKIKDTSTKLDIDKLYNIEDIVDSSILFKLYPEIKNVKIKLYEAEKSNRRVKGYYSNGIIHISNIPGLSSRYEGVEYETDRSVTFVSDIAREIFWSDKILTFVHEIQHLIQDIESFPTGGNYETILNKTREILGTDLSTPLGVLQNDVNTAIESGNIGQEDLSILKVAKKGIDIIFEDYNNGGVSIRKAEDFQYSMIFGEFEARVIENIKEKYQGKEITFKDVRDELAKSENIKIDELAVVRLAPTIQLQKALDKVGVSLTTAGFVHNNDVYLNTENPNILNTALHEHGHLMLDVLKENRLDVYNAGLKLVEKNAAEAKNYVDYVKQTQPSLVEGTERFNNEVLAQVIGDSGERLINSKKKDSLSNWVQELWAAIKEILGISNYTADQVSNMTLEEFGRAVNAEMLSGEDVGSFSSRNNDIRFAMIGEVGALNLDNLGEATFRLDALMKAKDMRISGESPRTIKATTGWEYNDVINEWQFELQDDFTLKTINIDGKDVSEVIDFPELFESHPSVKNTSIEVVSFEDVEFDGNYQPNRDVIQISSYLVDEDTQKQLISVLAHELHHKVQELEGWAPASRQDIDRYASGTPKLNLKSNYSDVADNSPELIEDTLELFAKYKDFKIFFQSPDNNVLQLLNFWLEDVFGEKVKSVEGISRVTIDGKAYRSFEDETKYEATKEGVISLLQADIADFKIRNDVTSLKQIDKELLSAEKGSEREDDLLASKRVLTKKYEDVKKVKNGEYTVESEPSLLLQVKKALEELPNFTPEQVARSIRRLIESGELDADDTYFKTQSEVEARNIQSRLSMSAEERLQTLFEETEDVAREDQIFIRGVLGNSLMFSQPTIENRVSKDSLKLNKVSDLIDFDINFMDLYDEKEVGSINDEINECE